MVLLFTSVDPHDGASTFDLNIGCESVSRRVSVQVNATRYLT